MNKSEIAEKARKRFAFEQYAKTVTWNTYEGDDDPFAFFPESGVYANGDIQLAWLGWQWRERAIAESQAQPDIKLGGIIDAFDGLPNDIATDPSIYHLRTLIDAVRGGFKIVPARRQR
jgi:hypothetical protein